MSSHLEMDISALRQTLRAQRRTLSLETRQQAAQKLLQQFQQLPMLPSWQHIAVYLAFDGEIDLRPVIAWCWQQQKNCYLPVVPDKGQQLSFVRYTPQTVLEKNRFNILQPSVNNAIVPIDKLDAVLIPLVAFDQYGYRLGMGGGFYDVTFQQAQNKPFLLGTGYAFQQISNLLNKTTDVRLHGILTEDGYIVIPDEFSGFV